MRIAIDPGFRKLSAQFSNGLDKNIFLCYNVDNQTNKGNKKMTNKFRITYNHQICDTYEEACDIIADEHPEILDDDQPDFFDDNIEEFDDNFEDFGGGEWE